MKPRELAEMDNLLAPQTIDPNVPPLYDLQQAIVDSPAKRKVIACGRKVGKTFLAAWIAQNRLRSGQWLLYLAPTQDQTDRFWWYLTRWMEDVPGLYKHEGRRMLRLNDGLVLAKTGHTPRILRGGGWGTVLFDEAAFLDSAIWYEVGAPMLLETDGDAWFFSTPNRRNWFFLLYSEAVQNTDGRWAHWNFPSHANPFLKPDALHSMISDMTDETYRQEILAQFLESSGAVFRHVQERATLKRRDPYEGHFFFGVDWAQKQDYTAIAVIDADTHEMVDWDHFTGVSWSLQRGRLRTLYDAWKPQSIIAESNSVGSPNIEALQQEGLPVVSFETTASSKPPLIESLALAFDRAELTVLDDAVLVGELLAYERKVSAMTGRSQYSAPEGLHDDCVIALALAWHGVTNAAFMEPFLIDW